MVKTFDISVRMMMTSTGYLVIDSEDVPGLFLSSREYENTMEDLLPAIKILLEHNGENIPHTARKTYGPYKWTTSKFVEHVMQVGIESTANLFGETGDTVEHWYIEAEIEFNKEINK